MLFGRDLPLPVDLLFSRPPDAPLAPEEYVEKLQARMEEMQHLARERIGMASEKMKTRYDARAAGHDLHEGNKIESTVPLPGGRKGKQKREQPKIESDRVALSDSDCGGRRFRKILNPRL
ncbi:retrovirus-related Pol polyprotein from transposon 412 [Trichonephila clavipes]|uniref:Retrovirus-related Pol polyprotein from transposon 412 n=1 Tax=Trichonephila clavipes TaxID=2585209 RepID=A0A8X7BKD2_TRICX|nr:retrovirus-related Pol polyprotein from transposon 412 [Trichonephila clavipes]